MTTPVPGPAASVLSAILVANPDDPDSPLSVAVFSQSGQAPVLPSLANDVVAMPEDALLDANATFTGFLSTQGLTGAIAPARWVGGTTAGAPTQAPAGGFSAGDFMVSGDGNVYICTVAGSPGTWVASGSTVVGSASGDLSGTYPGPNVANTHLATQSVSTASTLGGTSAPVVLTSTSTAAFTLTLPATPTAGRTFVIVDDSGTWNTHNLTVARNGKNIDGAAANLTLTSQWGKVWLFYDGTAWWTFAAWPAGSGVATVTAANTSVTIGGSGTNPTVATGTLDVIATQEPPAANWSNNGKKITGLANGTASTDAAAFGQVPVAPAASVNYKPTNPTGTTSATELMMGLGSTCAYTPTGSGKVIVTITGLYTMTGGTGNVTLDPRFGTGTAPANAAAVTGTAFGNGGAAPHVGGATNLTPFAFTDRLALTGGTPYWFDIAIAASANTAAIQNISVTLAEQLS